MTTKGYRLLAETLRRMHDRMSALDTAHELVKTLKQDSPRFKPEVFMKAAGFLREDAL